MIINAESGKNHHFKQHIFYSLSPKVIPSDSKLKYSTLVRRLFERSFGAEKFFFSDSPPFPNYDVFTLVSLLLL
jgi:hypothetical protein